LIIAGASPLVLMQTTGLFESGDALRNVAFDFQLPVFALVGARNWSNPRSTDSARRFALPILTAWEMDLVLLETEADKPGLAEHYRRCQAARRPGIALLAE
jgi:sulfopyruvate decarboxylase TPP-binding subunit